VNKSQCGVIEISLVGYQNFHFAFGSKNRLTFDLHIHARRAADGQAKILCGVLTQAGNTRMDLYRRAVMKTKIAGACTRWALPVLLALTFSTVLFGQDAEPAGPSTAELKVMVDTLWVMVAGFLVFWMNAGFGCVEAGLCRAKNTTNILGKNFIVFAFSTLAYWIIGFGIMFGDGSSFMGMSGFLLGGADNSPAMGDAYQGIFGSLNWTGVPLLAKFFFQLVFAGTAATIVSGCVAERCCTVRHR
jgi:hypothetical protein